MLITHRALGWSMTLPACLYLCACGDVPPTAPPPATPPGAAAPATPASGSPEAHTPSLIAAAPPTSTFVFRLDVRRLRSAPLHAGLREAMNMVDGIAGTLRSWSDTCGFDVLDALDEVVVASYPESKGPLFLARVKAGGPDPLPCAVAVTGAPGQPEIRGETRVVRGPGAVIAVEGPVLAFGVEAEVRSGLAALRSGAAPASPLARALAAMGPQVIAAALSDRGIGFQSATARIDADLGGLRGAVRVELSNAAGASDVINGMRAEVAATRASGLLAGPLAGRMEAVLSAIQVSATGTTVEALVDVRGGAVEQAAAANVFTALAAGGTRLYQDVSRAAGARRNVDAIATLLKSYVEREGKKRFPASAPLTPSTVPAMVPYRPSPTDWDHPTWRAIGFAPMQDTLYAYAIEISKDGRSAEVVARGDLDGDGKQSRFVRRLGFASDGAVGISASTTVTDELE